MNTGAFPGIAWQFAVWILYGAVSGWLFFRGGIRLGNLALFAACLYAGSRILSSEILLGFAILLLLVCAAESFWAAGVALASMGALFSMNPTAGLCAASAILIWAIADPRRRVAAPIALIGIPVAFVALVRNPRTAFDIVSGYCVAMSAGVESFADLRDALLLVAGFATLAATLAWRKQPAFPIAICLAGPLSIAFKYAFVRPDEHLWIFFSVVPLLLAAAVLAMDFGKNAWPSAAAVAAIALLWIPRADTAAFDPWEGLRNARRLLDMPALRAELQAQRDAALAPDRIEELPRASTAVFPYEAAIPFASGVESRPFPSIQAHRAYTRWLDAANATGLTAQQIVVHWDTVDGRHPFLDAPRLTLAMLQHYDFSRELPGGRLLLQRRAGPRFQVIRKTGEATLRIGQALTLPPSAKPQLMRVDLKLTAQGQLRKLFWKLPPARILLSAPGGRVLAARLIPDVLGNPGGVSFLPANLGELRQILEQNSIRDAYNEMVIYTDSYEAEAKVEYFEIGDWDATIQQAPAAPDLSGLVNQGEARAARIDSMNGAGAGEADISTIPCPDGYVSIRGWAFDYSERKPASAVYLQIDGRLFRTDYGESRMDNVALFDRNYALARTGFSTAIPLTRLGEGVHEMRVVVLSPDGRKYSTGAKPVRFQTQ